MTIGLQHNRKQHNHGVHRSRNHNNQRRSNGVHRNRKHLPQMDGVRHSNLLSHP